MAGWQEQRDEPQAVRLLADSLQRAGVQMIFEPLDAVQYDPRAMTKRGIDRERPEGM